MTSDIDTAQAIDLPGTRGGKRRALILAAFHDCIISKGYAKTTLRDVAQALGIEYNQRESWQRRKELRAACRARGFTLEDAAEMWLQVN